MKVFCIECGGSVEDTDSHCEQCGAAQELIEPADAAPAPAMPTAAVTAVQAPPPPVETLPANGTAPPPPVVTKPGAVCANCGSLFPPDSRFCGACGAPRGGTVTAGSASAPNGGAAMAAPHGGRTAGAPQSGAETAAPHGGGTVAAPHVGAPMPGTHGGAATARSYGGAATATPYGGAAGTSEVASPPRPSVPPRLTAPPAGEWQAALPERFRRLPVDVLAVCALMAVAGVLILLPAVRSLPGLLDLLTAGDGFSRAFGALFLMLWVLLAFFGGACLLLAWRLATGDRVARGLTYVLLGTLSVSLLLAEGRQSELTIVMLLSAGAGLVLAFSPGARAFFGGGYQGEHPEGLVIARTLVAVWAGIVCLVGLTLLPLGSLGGKFVFVGLVLLALGAVAFYFNGRLGTGDPVARVVITGGAAVYLVLLLVLGERSAGLLLPLGMVLGIAGFLWVPADVQRHFAR